ncbi:hypothetical protein MTR_2g042340 [Medicago truncatula]|uniref:Uncharacterized protein n=1 Tax=Medicago truncatula TaxID=3880 RepID=G7IGF8_MEDTR|nr:hypothetical protein MTR_2g042340 [Medicago truncatula]
MSTIRNNDMGYSDPPPNANNSRNTNPPISNQGKSLGYSSPPPNANNGSQRSQTIRVLWRVEISYGKKIYSSK